jgi:phage host-nuclease inhibitor protein Gam
MTELTAAKDEAAHAKADVNNLLKKVEVLSKEVENMETENNDLLASQAESKKAIQAMQALKNENIKLSAVGGSSNKGDEDRVDMEEKIVSLETAVQEWTDLAKVSQHRKAMLAQLY